MTNTVFLLNSELYTYMCTSVYVYIVLFRTWYICTHLYMHIILSNNSELCLHLQLVALSRKCRPSCFYFEPHLIFQIACRPCFKWFIPCFNVIAVINEYFLLLLIDDRYKPCCLTSFLICIGDNNHMRLTSGNEDLKSLCI